LCRVFKAMNESSCVQTEHSVSVTKYAVCGQRQKRGTLFESAKRRIQVFEVERRSCIANNDSGGFSLNNTAEVFRQVWMYQKMRGVTV